MRCLPGSNMTSDQDGEIPGKILMEEGKKKLDKTKTSIGFFQKNNFVRSCALLSAAKSWFLRNDDDTGAKDAASAIQALNFRLLHACRRLQYSEFDSGLIRLSEISRVISGLSVELKAQAHNEVSSLDQGQERWDKTLGVMQHHTNGISGLIKFVSVSCIEVLGPAPCSFAHFVLSEVGEICLDHALKSAENHYILVKNNAPGIPEVREYFSWYITLFQCVLVGADAQLHNSLAASAKDNSPLKNSLLPYEFSEETDTQKIQSTEAMIEHLLAVRKLFLRIFFVNGKKEMFISMKTLCEDALQKNEKIRQETAFVFTQFDFTIGTKMLLDLIICIGRVLVPGCTDEPSAVLEKMKKAGYIDDDICESLIKALTEVIRTSLKQSRYRRKTITATDTELVTKNLKLLADYILKYKSVEKSRCIQMLQMCSSNLKFQESDMKVIVVIQLSEIVTDAIATVYSETRYTFFTKCCHIIAVSNIRTQIALISLKTSVDRHYGIRTKVLNDTNRFIKNYPAKCGGETYAVLVGIVTFCKDAENFNITRSKSVVGDLVQYANDAKNGCPHDLKSIIYDIEHCLDTMISVRHQIKYVAELFKKTLEAADGMPWNDDLEGLKLRQGLDMLKNLVFNKIPKILEDIETSYRNHAAKILSGVIANLVRKVPNSNAISNPVRKAIRVLIECYSSCYSNLSSEFSQAVIATPFVTKPMPTWSKQQYILSNVEIQIDRLTQSFFRRDTTINWMEEPRGPLKSKFLTAREIKNNVGWGKEGADDVDGHAMESVWNDVPMTDQVLKIQNLARKIVVAHEPITRPEEIREIVETANICERAVELEFRDCGLTKNSLRDLNDRLAKTDLQIRKFTVAATKNVATLFQEIQRLLQRGGIRVLGLDESDVQANDLKNATTIEFEKPTRAALFHNNILSTALLRLTLTALDISYNKTIVDFSLLGEVLWSSSITHLAMVDCGLKDDQMNSLQLAVKCGMITNLNISYNTDLTENGYTTVCRILTRYLIEGFVLSGCEISASSLVAIQGTLDKQAEIEYLDLSYSGAVTGDWIKEMCTLLKQRGVRRACVAGCDFDPGLLNDLRESLHQCKLEDLDMGDNPAIRSAMKDLGLLIKENRLLTLRYADCLPNHRHILDFVEGLGEWQVETLDISNWERNVTPEFAEAVGEHLITCVKKKILLCCAQINENCKQIFQNYVNKQDNEEFHIVIEKAKEKVIEMQGFTIVLEKCEPKVIEKKRR